jgi:hypothetical protein
MKQIYSELTTSVKIPDTFTQYTRNNYPDYIEFISKYYESREIEFADLDLCNNLINYFNIGNYTVSALTEYTELSNLVSLTDTVIYANTHGFPTNGFIQIDDEIIYYTGKTSSSFTGCIRGASSSKILDNKLVFITSTPKVHETSKCFNIGFTFLKHLLTKISAELLPFINKKIHEDIPYNILIPQIKEFYKSKGNVFAIKFLFKIVYNDAIIQLKLAPRGRNASIALTILSGVITSVNILDGGIGYINQNDAFANVIVIGSGTGAELRITSINNLGTITGIELVSGGVNYTNNTSVYIQERDFGNSSSITGVTSGAIGISRYYNPDIERLDLYNVHGKFIVGEQIVSTSKLYTVAYIQKIDIINITPSVQYPFENTITTSESNNYSGQDILLEYSGNINSEIIKNIINFGDKKLIQNSLSNINKYSANLNSVKLVYSDDKKLLFTVNLDDICTKFFYPPYTNLVNDLGTEIYVDSTIGFPLIDGIISIDGEYISYKHKSVNRFYDLTRNVSIQSDYNPPKDNSVYLVGNSIAAYPYYELFLLNLVCGNNIYQVRLIGVAGNTKIVSSGYNYHNSKFNSSTEYRSTSSNIVAHATSNNIYEHDGHIYITGDGIPTRIHNNTRAYSKQPILRRINGKF